MKKVILVAAIICSQFSFGQKTKGITDEKVKELYNSIPKVDGHYEYSAVVQLDSNYKKDIVYRNSKLVFANTFKSAKCVLQYDNGGKGKVIGKGNFNTVGLEDNLLVSYYAKWRVNFNFELFSKDGKYSYRLYNINIESNAITTGGDSPSNIDSQLSIDDAFYQTQKSATREMYRKMFSEVIDNINRTISEIKFYMAKKQALSI